MEEGGKGRGGRKRGRLNTNPSFCRSAEFLQDVLYKLEWEGRRIGGIKRGERRESEKVEEERVGEWRRSPKRL
jgi:hypothetical protein